MTSSIKKLSESEIEDDARKKSPLDAEFVDPIKRDEELPPISYFKLFRYATKLDLTLIIIGLLSAITTGLCAPFQMLIFGKLIEDMIANQMNNQNATIADLFLDNISTFAINNSIIGAIMLVFSYLAVALLNYSALRQIFHIRGLFFKKTLNQDISWYDLHQTGDFASRMSEDLAKLEEGLGEKIGMFVFHQVSFIGSLILAFVKGWELALICMISLPVTMVAMILVSRMTTSLAKKEMEEYGKAGSIAEEVISTIRTVIAFGGQEKENERYSSRLIFACKNNIKKSFFSGLGFGILWFLIYASYALAFWYGVGLIIRERKAEVTDPVYTPGVMITVFFSVMMGSMNFGMSSPFIENFAVACGAGAKVFSVIDSVPTIDSLSKEGDFPNTINGSITFRNVHFQYPSRPNVKILQGLDLTISRGETVALVGTSGCGKSTCIQLIQRFYDPSSGTILLDNQDIKTLNVGWLRNQIGVVGQEPVLFGTTIAENIRQGYPHATQREIEEAARKANAHDFIITLPKGYDTLVGERGAQMSGGQKQRIAIARALIRNPAILLLDEATSALDTSSEAKVQKALDKASEGRTTIIIAHRLTTIRGADKIVVISNGAVVEIGTHGELMKKQEHYYSLVTAQVTSEEAFEEDEDEHVPIQRALQRNTSIDSSGSSLNDKRNSYVPEITTDLDDYDDESDSPPSISMLQILEYNKEEWPQILAACIGSFIMGAAMPIFAVLFGDILGTLANDDVDEIREQTNIYAIMFVVVGVIAGVSVFLQQYMFGIAGEKLTMRLRGFMFEAILKQEIGWFDDEKQGTGSLCARLSGEAACVQGATGQRIGTVLQSLATISLAVGLSMYYEWRLGFVAMSFTPFILIATYFQRGIMMKETQEHQHSMEHANKLAVEAVSNVRTVVSLNREIAFYDQYVTELIPGFALAKRNVHYRGFVFGAARSIMFFAYAACMMYGGHLIKHDNLHYEKVLKVSQALIMGTVSIANALAFAPNFQKGLTAAAKIIFLLNRKPKVYDAPGVKHEKWFCDGNVEYKEVTFVYPTRPDTRVLKNLNLAIQHGKTIALVGPSGCGKSTTIQLLERFYDPFAGNVLLDGKDLQADLAQSTLRSQLGIVSQEPSLFDRSIEDNIAYGDNSRIVSRTEVIEAAKNANIHNFIVSLPLGYETRLGEKATQLSGGQKQRIAIARALVRNPRVLLLDEATSALDAESEQVVQDALDKAKEGRTCITIAHRLSTIQDADVICVINRGKIAEMGTHQDLLAMRGIYFQLHSYQSGQKS